MSTCKILCWLACVYLLSEVCAGQTTDGPSAPSKHPASTKGSLSINFQAKPREPQIISFTPLAAKAGERRMLSHALGSLKVVILANDGKHCTFDYTVEVEQGYTTYRCHVPVSDPDVTIDASLGEFDVKTSFKLDQCTVVRVGGPWFWYHDVKLGTGGTAKDAKKVRLRYSVYVDDKFTKLMDGVPPNQLLESDFPAKRIGGAVYGVLEGMKAGGKRQAAISRSDANAFIAAFPELKGDGWLCIEFEMLPAK